MTRGLTIRSARQCRARSASADVADYRLTVAAITHDAWTIARIGSTDNAEWRAAVERIAQAWNQISEPEANR